MIKVKVSKLKFTELEVIQEELYYYSIHIRNNDIKKDFLTAITILDINSTLYYLLRNRMEKPQSEHTISFSVSQAATILKCYQHNRIGRPECNENVLRKLSFIIDPILRS